MRKDIEEGWPGLFASPMLSGDDDKGSERTVVIDEQPGSLSTIRVCSSKGTARLDVIAQD